MRQGYYWVIHKDGHLWEIVWRTDENVYRIYINKIYKPEDFEGWHYIAKPRFGQMAAPQQAKGSKADPSPFCPSPG